MNMKGGRFADRSGRYWSFYADMIMSIVHQYPELDPDPAPSKGLRDPCQADRLWRKTLSV